MALVTDSASFDRRAIMLEAHRIFLMTRWRGWTFGQALAFAWSRAREARDGRLGELRAFERFERASCV